MFLRKKMIDKEGWKYAFYYGTRFQIWSFLFKPLCFTLAIAVSILVSIIVVSIWPFSFLQLYFLSYFSGIASIIYEKKLALGKVFFKKYKHFELNPKANISKKNGKVSWKIATKLYVTIFSLSIFLFCLTFWVYDLIYDITESLEFILPGLINLTQNDYLWIGKFLKLMAKCWTIIPVNFILGYFLKIAILKWFVSRNATITSKDKKAAPILEIRH